MTRLIKYKMTYRDVKGLKHRSSIVAQNSTEARLLWSERNPVLLICGVEEFRYEICQVCHQPLVRRLSYVDVCANLSCSEYWGKDTS